MNLSHIIGRARWGGLAVVAALLAISTTLSSCSTIIAEMSRECIREGYQTVQVCQRYEANGHCAHYGSSTRQVCLERAPRETSYTAPEPAYTPPQQTYSSPAPATASSPAPAAAPKYDPTDDEEFMQMLVGTSWRGSYVCGQGQTGALLEMGEIGPNGLESRFSFYALEQNPGVPSGSYWVDVLPVADLMFMTPVEWINQPDGYVMIGATGQLYVEDYGEGEVAQLVAIIPDTPGCTAMTLELQ